MEDPAPQQLSDNSQGSSTSRNNPRRKPAHESVSLRHTRKSQTLPAQESEQARLQRQHAASSGSSMDVDPSDGAPARPHVTKDSSGESSNPEKWFEKSNNNVKRSSASFGDDEPPFFLQQSSSENTPPEVLRRRLQAQTQQSGDAAPMFDVDDADSSEDFRSVIDDLTIENQRLKRKLRKYERLHNHQLQPEALFEVRVHGLPPEKKRDLEDLLQNFVAKMRSSPSQANLSAANLSSNASAFPAGLNNGRTPSSGSRIGDSAYASLSASNGNERSNSGQSNPMPQKPGQLPTGKAQSSSYGTLGGSMAQAPAGKAQSSTYGTQMGSTPVQIHQHPELKAQTSHNSSVIDPEGMNTDRKAEIHSYLSEIPLGLIPHQTGPISEKEKKKMVVRRLEQLFAGRDQSAGGHQQPKQQEKVAQSAARADRRRTEASGDTWSREGHREAKIMQGELAEKAEKKIRAEKPAQPAELQTHASGSSSHSSSTESLIEQRPTRPLDLDPYRAQIPEENMQYIRHLGFSPPHAQTMAAKTDGHGWIYLNVLHNMAQLHLSNVTVDYVRKAIMTYSKKLELSPDGRKLRWKGGHQLTGTSSSNSPDQNMENDQQPKSKHSNEGKLSSIAFAPQKNQLAYSPLFRREESETNTSGADEENYQLSNAHGASSGQASGSNRVGKGSRDNAPIIFYNNLGFYTDLSGDPSAVSKSRKSAYNRIGQAPVGMHSDVSTLDLLRKLEFEKGPLSQTIIAKLPSDAGASRSSGSLQVIASRESTESSSYTPDPLEFEASGLGGVRPADNFSISVRTRQNTENPSAKHSRAESYRAHTRAKAYPTGIRRALQRTSSTNNSPLNTSKSASGSTNLRSVIQRNIISSRKRELSPSRLPEGSYFYNASDSEDDDEDMQYVNSDEEGSVDIPVAAPQRMDWATSIDDNLASPLAHPTYSRSYSSDSGEEDASNTSRRVLANDSDAGSDGDNESIDLLAHARTIDPETIRIREREFDSSVAERLANDIPAGSSAATAEGGSGFNSPHITAGGPPIPERTMSVAATIGSNATSTHQPRQSDVASKVAAALPPPPSPQVGSRKMAGLKRQRHSDDSTGADVPGVRATKSPKMGGKTDAVSGHSSD